LAVPEPDSAWSVKSGEYQILKKEERHYSPIADTYFPYAMQFFGNGLIHGELSGEKGRLATGQIGSFQLESADAQEIFDWADEKTKVMVFGSDLANSSNYFSYVFVNEAKLPLITAPSFLAIDLLNGEVLASRNKDAAMPVASITKLVTALTILELDNSDTLVAVSKSAFETYGNEAKLKVNEQIKVGDLLYALLLESSNDAAEVLAESVGRENFILKMNEVAKKIGMKNSRFADPSGLSAHNVSTASDLAKLLAYLKRNRPDLLDMTKEKSYQYDRTRIWHNRNNLIGMAYYGGGKNGYTDEANRTLAAVFDLPLSEFDMRPVGVIVLGSEDRPLDTRRLVSFVVNNVFYTGRSAFTLLAGENSQ